MTLAHDGGEAGCAKVLIVEDEFLVALQLEDILTDEGFRVVGTVPDRASLSLLSDPPDVALVDLNLRDGLTGPEIARELAGAFATKVVYVTANPNQIGAPAATAVGIIQKPFSRAAILAAIDYALGRRADPGPPAGLEPLRAN
ncbi:MAG TPA: response regulator [Novosphingobium sp.]|nr:response regulator [Novosphingobium sp.]